MRRGTSPRRRSPSSRASPCPRSPTQHRPMWPSTTRVHRRTQVRRSARHKAPASLPCKERRHMDYFGAGLAAMGVIGPGIGIGILGGMAAGAIGRNPDAAGAIRGLAIILAAFAEGLGVLAIVVGLLAIFIQPA